MFKRNDSKLFSSSLIATVLATGLMAQGAGATVGPGHEPGDSISHEASQLTLEREGPRGEVLLQQKDPKPTKVSNNDGGRVGPLPTGNVRAN